MRFKHLFTAVGNLVGALTLDAVVIIGCSLVFSMPSQAAFVDPNTTGGVQVPVSGWVDLGNGLFYDAQDNLTWLRDANYAKTSGFDDDGRMNWYAAMSWAENLNYAGYSDWRLPHAGEGELSNLSSVPGLIQNYQSGAYWTSISCTLTSFCNNPSLVNSPHMPVFSDWAFVTHPHHAATFLTGGVNSAAKSSELYVWAVRDGGAPTTVPIPGTIWLFGSAIPGLIGWGRRKTA